MFWLTCYSLAVSGPVEPCINSMLRVKAESTASHWARRVPHKHPQTLLRIRDDGLYYISEDPPRILSAFSIARRRKVLSAAC